MLFSLLCTLLSTGFDTGGFRIAQAAIGKALPAFVAPLLSGRTGMMPRLDGMMPPPPPEARTREVRLDGCWPPPPPEVSQSRTRLVT